MKRKKMTAWLSGMLCILMLFTSAAAETRQGVIALEGMEESIEETLFESDLGFSFWYPADRLEAYEGEADNIEGLLVGGAGGCGRGAVECVEDAGTLSITTDADCLCLFISSGLRCEDRRCHVADAAEHKRDGAVAVLRDFFH